MSIAPLALAQDPVVQTDEETGIDFLTWTQEAASSFTFGIALPPTALTEDADEYIGLLVCGTHRRWRFSRNIPSEESSLMMRLAQLLPARRP